MDVSLADVEAGFVGRVVVVVGLDAVVVAVAVPVVVLPQSRAAGLLERGDDQLVRFRPRAFHVAAPFARAPHVVLGQAMVLQQRAFDQRVDPALQQVRGACHWPAGQKSGFEEGEQHALAEQFLQPPVAASQLLVRPPPPVPRRLGVGRVVARVGAFGDELLPPFVPGVQLFVNNGECAR